MTKLNRNQTTRTTRPRELTVRLAATPLGDRRTPLVAPQPSAALSPVEIEPRKEGAPVADVAALERVHLDALTSAKAKFAAELAMIERQRRDALAAREERHLIELLALKDAAQKELGELNRQLCEAQSLSAVRLGIPPDLILAGARAAEGARAEQTRRAELAAKNEADRGKRFAPAPMSIRSFD